MDVIEEDICIIQRFRVTEFQVLSGKDIVTIYFNIRDEQGQVHGRHFDNIEEPLNLLLDLIERQ